MAKKTNDTRERMKEMFIDCINKGYGHFGFRGDFVFIFDDTVDISHNDIERYRELCEVCNSDEFYDKLHGNAVQRGIEDIDIYEQCMRNHFNEGNALPFIKSIRIMGRKDLTIENTLKEELDEFLRSREELSESELCFAEAASAVPVGMPKEKRVEDFIENRSKEENFNQAIVHLIDASGKKDSDIYKKASVIKATFSNLRGGKKVSKMTALQLCVALELDYEQTQAMLAKAGMALGNNKSDFIFEFFIRKGIFDIDIINNALYDNGCKTITRND